MIRNTLFMCARVRLLRLMCLRFSVIITSIAIIRMLCAGAIVVVVTIT